MIGLYFDRILNLTTDWISTPNLLRAISGDPTGISKDLQALIGSDLKWLEIQTVKSESGQNVNEYKRIDIPQTKDQFDSMMKFFEDNKQLAIKEIKKMKYCITTPKTKKITKKGKDFLKRVQSELLDMAFMVMIRFKYQDTLKLLPHSVINQRLQIIQNFVDSVMKELKLFNNEKIIKEYFQNHSHQISAFKV